MKTARTAFMAMAAAATLLGASPAVAHARLISSSPVADARLQTAPRTISLVFNERVIPAFSRLKLSMPEHGMDVPVTSAVSEDGKRIVGTLKSPLHKGSYTVHWTAAGPDGHKMEGQLNFRVG